MGSSTATRSPVHDALERMDGDHARLALEHRPTMGDPRAASRTAGIVLGAAVTAMGLLAGIFLAFDIAVMPALADADDRTFFEANQRMIDTMNASGPFLLTFFGAPALAVAAFFQARRRGTGSVAGWIVAGLAFYMVQFVVSLVIHFPLNDELMRAGEPARIENLGAVRDDFVTSWVPWNVVRTLALTAAFVSLARALVLRGRMARAG